jgi:hypothetical protein
MTNHILDSLPKARSSAARFVLEPIAEYLDMEVDELFDAVEAAVSALTLTPSPEGFREAVRLFAEPYAIHIDVPWVDVADMILGTLSWDIDVPKTALDNWK